MLKRTDTCKRLFYDRMTSHSHAELHEEVLQRHGLPFLLSSGPGHSPARFALEAFPWGMGHRQALPKVKY
jgi:hypothetical protein